ncbi:SMP-30/gluconolactonase/LRE family protein [Lentisphaera marina]|uniref:SMP-30/gluconolactonase/LRE family protein n=1 Tax=Lentisphaera marina TaxID=1111041 RepID=UPI002365BCC5|nr:SMP-30/gluconolactonase/LRE family protein [Lentisphaera marina]MDD7986978.1 SMP-30/gluconolactonase/LRE family protein [Lentisphaera marina]
MSKDLEVAFDVSSVLGEGPCWSEFGFSWVDILGKKIWQERDGKLNSISMEMMPSSLAYDEQGDLVFTLNDGYYRFEKGELKALKTIDSLSADLRFNDGKVDAQGRYWAGTMDMKEQSPLGSLYVLDKTECFKVLDDITTSNGLCWGDDVFYYVDSPTKQIKKYFYDSDSLSIIGGEVLFEVAEDEVFPDGMCIDSEGHLWLALWNGYKVLRINSSTGVVMDEIDVPCKKVTSCCFGGVDHKELYITSASHEMNEDDWLHYPDSGKVFKCRPGVEAPLLNYFKH